MKLEKNASACMKAFPFWIVPYTFYMYYLSLFLMDRGLVESQIAQLMTITNVASLIFSFVASPVVDRLGRKRTLLVFDIVSSSVPALIYYLSQNFVAAVIANVFAGMNRIMSTAYYLIMIEDTSDENSMKSMNMFNIITVISGLLTPVAGIVIEKTGLVNGEKIFLGASFILMTLQAVFRHFAIDETPTGKFVMTSKQKSSIKDIFNTYGGTLKFIAREKNVLSALIINGLVYVYYNIGTTTSMLFTPYFANYRNLSGIALSSVGAVYAAGTLLSMFVINPRMTKKNIYPFTVIACLVSIAGFVLLMACPMGNNVLLFAAIILLALSYGVLKSVADSLLAMETSGEFSSGIYSLSFVLAAVLSVIALQAIEFLYGISPNWLFGLSLILIVLILMDCVLYRRKNNA